MKLEIKEIKPVPPPRRFILDLSEEEAYLLRCFVDYYVGMALTGSRGPAKRLSKKLASASGSTAVYPYEKAFTDE